MTPNDQALPREILFEPDGHLAQVALTCVADGELGLVSAEALGHLDGCDRCTARLGEEALLSVSAGSALAGLSTAPEAALAPAVTMGGDPPFPPLTAALPATIAPLAARPAPEPARSSMPVPTPRRQRRPLPVAAIAAALVLAVMTALPSMATALQGAPAAIAEAASVVPFLIRVGSAFVRAPWAHGAAALLVKCVTAVVLCLIGLQVARIKSRSGSWQEGGV